MAVLTNPEKDRLRQEMANKVAEVTWTKATINAALQAIEDWNADKNTKPGQALSGQINAATAPFVFTAAEKGLLTPIWRGTQGLLVRFGDDQEFQERAGL